MQRHSIVWLHLMFPDGGLAQLYGDAVSLYNNLIFIFGVLPHGAYDHYEKRKDSWIDVVTLIINIFHNRSAYSISP